MKTRIISFFLVLVMLFSCLSLNIFAAEGDEAVATGAEEAVLTEADRNAIAAVTTDNLADYRISLDEEKEQGEGVQVTSTSLILTSQTKMKLYFTASSAATVKVGDKALTKYASENDGEYYVLIDGVNPAGLDEEVTLTITDGDKAYHYSLEIYEDDEGHSQLNITKK